MKAITKHVAATTAVLIAGAVAAFAALVLSGTYDFAADDPHTAPVAALLETMRDRSIDARASKVVVPDLGDRQRVVDGAGNYDAMCAACHLAPGLQETELSKGLYPTPPNLTREKVRPGHAFWVIKHGVKASGMPAWGKSMDDEDIWSLTAFLQKLPDLDADAYRGLVEQSSGHSHGGGESSGHGHDENAGHGHDEKANHGHDENTAADKPPPHAHPQGGHAAAGPHPHPAKPSSAGASPR